VPIFLFFIKVGTFPLNEYQVNQLNKPSIWQKNVNASFVCNWQNWLQFPNEARRNPLLSKPGGPPGSLGKKAD